MANKPHYPKDMTLTELIRAAWVDDISPEETYICANKMGYPISLQGIKYAFALQDARLAHEVLQEREETDATVH